MSTTMIFEMLSDEQKEKVQDAFGTQKRPCSGCATHLGMTEMGEYTYFWHYGASEEYLALPVGDEHPHFDYETGNITVAGRVFGLDGEEVLPPPFEYLVHMDLRESPAYKERVLEGGFISQQEEDDFLFGCGGGSYLPKRAAERVGVEQGVVIAWVANSRIRPEELDSQIWDIAVAITQVYPDGRRKIVL